LCEIGGIKLDTKRIPQKEENNYEEKDYDLSPVFKFLFSKRHLIEKTTELDVLSP
jgi:hypothetical protein